MTAAHAVAAMASDGVDFIDENEARRVFAALFEHVADARCADTDEHFDEVRAGDREERDIRLTGDGAGEQGFAGAGRADHQDALRNRAAEFLELAGVAEEIDDFKQLFLGFLDAGDVFEGDLIAVHREQAGLALAEGHRAAASGFHLLAEEEKQDADDQQERQEGEKGAAEVVLVALVDGLVLDEFVEVLALDGGRDGDAELDGSGDHSLGVELRGRKGDELAGADDHGVVRAGSGKDAE